MPKMEYLPLDFMLKSWKIGQKTIFLFLFSQNRVTKIICFTPFFPGFQPKVPLPRFGEPPHQEEDFDPLEHSSFPSPAMMANHNYNVCGEDYGEGMVEARRADRMLRERQRWV